MFNVHKKEFDTTYFGVISWVDEWINDVKKYGGGTFVVTSSVNAIFSKDLGGYGASKAAINSCFRSLRIQYYHDNVGFVTVLPGPVATNRLTGAAKNQPFIHLPENEAHYIVEQVFNRRQQIEPSWYYSFTVRRLNWLPDNIHAK